jgi:hypothetical protein
VAFDSLDVPFGESRCAVKIDAADGFPSDDISNFAVKRADPERVLFVHQATDNRSPLYFGAALGAAAQAAFVLQSITPDAAADIDPSKYAFVVLSDVDFVPSILENALLRNVEEGGSVLITTGTTVGRRGKIPVFGGGVQDTKYYGRAGGFETVGESDQGAWPDIKVFYAAQIDPGKARVVARLADGTPLLIDKQIGEGHVLLFASGLDNVTNDFPLSPLFVPFVDQTARYLSGEARLSGARVVDSFVQLRTETNQTGADAAKVANTGATVDIVGPDGKRPLSLKEAAAAESFQLARAGFYQIRFANGRDALIAVNPDARESDLEAIPDDTLKLWSGSAGAGPPEGTESAVANQKNISSLWWWVMLLLLINAVAESILASRYLGTLREAL